jgi:hypothetical protein
VQVRNSGFIGGKFLDRTYLPDVTSNMLYIGANVKLNGFPFHLTGADMFTIEFMETHSELFPSSDRDLVERLFHAGVRRIAEDASTLLSNARRAANNGVLGNLNNFLISRLIKLMMLELPVMHELLAKAGLELSLHQCLTLGRKLNHESTGSMRSVGNKTAVGWV